VKLKERRWPNNHSSTLNTARIEKQGAETQQEAIKGRKIWCLPPGPFDDQELLFNEQAFRNDGPPTTGPQEFGNCGEKLGEEYQ
jgi:hypothetical protein